MAKTISLASSRWTHLEDRRFGPMTVLSESIYRVAGQNPHALPDLHRGNTILVTSDFSGEHQTALYQTYSFLFANLEGCTAWRDQRDAVRLRWLSDGRRMAFKNLNDRNRQRALFPFLRAANKIPGLLATVLVHRDIQSLFTEDTRLDMDQPELQPFHNWKPSTMEKLLRVMHLGSFFIAGLSRPEQDILWLTDEDDIVANEDRVRDVVNIFGRISSHYLQHDLREFKFETTWSDPGTREVEDLVSIPDLVAGALSEVVTGYALDGAKPSPLFVIPPPRRVTPKARTIMDWFSDGTQPLKRLVYSVDKVAGTKKLAFSQWAFHGTVGTV